MSNTCKTAVILAGGKGTRLTSIAGNTPKALIRIGEFPVLEHQIRLLEEYGIEDIYLLLGHLAEPIKNFVEGKKWKSNIHIKQEQHALGTGGALQQLKNEVYEDFLVLSGDVMVNFDITRFTGWHKEKGGMVSLLVHPSDHPMDSDLVQIDTHSKVISLLQRPHEEGKNFSNISIASVYVCSPRIFQYILPGEKVDFEKDVLPVVLDAREYVYAYKTPEYIKDMGTPERLEHVRKDYESGKIQKMHLQNERRAIFFDRDGVLIEQVDQLSSVDSVHVYDFAVEAVTRVNKTDFMAILVTNQPMIAKGFITEQEADEIQKKLETELGKKGAKLDALYCCPHHPEKGFEGERSELKIECECRKPKPGMLLRAQKDFNLNLSESYMIGDQTADILAGERAGCKTVSVNTGYAGKDGKYEVKPDSTAVNVLAAVDTILFAE
jgi:histidinol-phosphate phosphatase family protein